MPINTCIVDQVQFSAARATTRYCSDKCRKAASRGTAPKKTAEPIEFEPSPIQRKALEEMDQPSFDAYTRRDRVTVISEKNIATGQAPTIPSSMEHQMAELRERMNQRLEAKGLPLIQSEMPPVEFVRTGYQELDELTAEHDSLGWGGFPRKHITEIYGTPGAGKTSLMKQIINFNPDLKVLYIDVENGLTNAPPNIMLMKVVILEDIAEIVCQALDTDEFDLIIVDSVAFMISQKEKENDKEAMMAQAKAMGRFIRRTNAYLRQLGDNGKLKDSPGTAVVFINQLRDTGNSFGVKEFTPGGRALSYGASYRMEFRSAKADKIIKEGRTVGQRVRTTITKSRFNGGDVGTTLVFKLMFGDL